MPLFFSGIIEVDNDDGNERRREHEHELLVTYAEFSSRCNMWS